MYALLRKLKVDQTCINCWCNFTANDTVYYEYKEAIEEPKRDGKCPKNGKTSSAQNSFISCTGKFDKGNTSKVY